MYLDLSKDVLMPPPFPNPVAVLVTASPNDRSGVDYKIQLTGVIGNLTEYVELLTVLRFAEKADRVYMFIDTPGGNVFTTQHIVYAMCAAECDDVITVASGNVKSCGTIIWFYGKKRIVYDWAEFLFHGTSHGASGNTVRISQEATIMVNYMKKTLYSMYQAGIITGKEYNKIVAGQCDVVLSGKQIRERLFNLTCAAEGFTAFRQEDGTVIINPEAPAADPSITPEAAPLAEPVPGIDPAADPIVVPEGDDDLPPALDPNADPMNPEVTPAGEPAALPDDEFEESLTGLNWEDDDDEAQLPPDPVPGDTVPTTVPEDPVVVPDDDGIVDPNSVPTGFDSARCR